MRANNFVMKDPAPGAVIANVGDSNIVIRFMGWVDQRETDFGKARSLSIREVKDKLEEEGFSLPEPIYRVKLDNMNGAELDLTASVPRTKLKAKPNPAPEMVDVQPDRSIDEKVDEEIEASGEINLLDDSKPTE